MRTPFLPLRPGEHRGEGQRSRKVKIMKCAPIAVKTMKYFARYFPHLTLQLFRSGTRKGQTSSIFSQKSRNKKAARRRLNENTLTVISYLRRRPRTSAPTPRTPNAIVVGSGTLTERVNPAPFSVPHPVIPGGVIGRP